MNGKTTFHAWHLEGFSKYQEIIHLKRGDISVNHVRYVATNMIPSAHC
jgi:hypothetical protein